MTIDMLISGIVKRGNPCIVGLDVGARELPRGFSEEGGGAGAAVRAFNRDVIDAVCDIVPAVAVNVPALLPYGLETASDAIEYAKGKGLYTIADAKCMCDPAAAESESELYFDLLGADCVTIGGYYGTLGAKPFLERCVDPEKSVFVLARSESGSPNELQGLVAGTRTVYRAVCERAWLWGEKNTGKLGYSNVGAMLGGLTNEQLREYRRAFKGMLFILTGYDGKRVSARDFRGAFDLRGLGGLAYVTRPITRPEGVWSKAAVREAAEAVRYDLRICF